MVSPASRLNDSTNIRQNAVLCSVSFSSSFARWPAIIARNTREYTGSM